MNKQDDAFEAGRLLGAVARRNRALVEAVKTVAKQRGMKPAEVVEEALEMWLMYSDLKDVDPKALVAALRFLEHMLYRAADILVRLSEVFTTGIVQSNLRVAAEIARSEVERVRQEAELKAKASSVKDELRQLLVTQMLGIVSSLMSMVSGMSGVPVQLSQRSQRKVIIEE